MAETSIQWTDFSTNPIRARLRNGGGKMKGGYDSGVGHYCEKISSGCANCYASSTQPRFGMPEFKGHKAESFFQHEKQAVAVSDEVEVFFDESKLQEVLKRKKPAKFFRCDMTDLFGSWVPDEWIDKCFATMALTPQHTHQVLTKRPERAASYMARIMADDGPSIASIGHEMSGKNYSLCIPLANVWLGASVENQQAADERIPILLKTPARVRFLSVEPLLGPVDLRETFQTGGYRNYLTGQFHDIPCKGVNGNPDFTVETDDKNLPKIDWVIVGGESGHGARRCDAGWIASVVRQCKAASARVFVKQLGSHATTAGDFAEKTGPVQGLKLIDSKGGNMAEWPEHLRVREFPEA